MITNYSAQRIKESKDENDFYETNKIILGAFQAPICRSVD